MKKYLFLIFCAGFFVFISGCNKNDDKAETVDFDNSHPYAIAPDVDWAVGVEPYVGFRGADEHDSSTNSYCRKDEILQVMGFSINRYGEQWYLFEKGWIPASSVVIYSNRYKAEAAVKQAAKNSKKGK